MKANRELPRTPLALAVMNLLMERPMHPYEMKSTMKERGHDQVIRLKGGSIYDTVERLEVGGFIKSQETSREGRRPERRVYAITEAGRDEITGWLAELLTQPVSEYPQFAAALAFMAALDKDQVARLLKTRIALLDGQIAGADKQLKNFLEMGLPRLFLVEGEYAVAMKRAELEWVRCLVDDIQGGKLWITKEQMKAFGEALESLMTLLDLTIVNVAIPSIVDDLPASLDQFLWVLNGYSLMYAVLLITSGRLGDIFGPRNMFAAGIVVFTIASAFSGLALDPTQLILARGAQGFGAAILAPQGLPIMTTLFPAERRGGVFAIYGALSGLAVLLGPVLGGFIVTHFGWRWIFYVNLPVGLITLVLAFLLVPDLRPGRRHRLDWLGVALATLGLFGVVFGLIEGQRYEWGTVWSGITIPEIIGAGLLVLAIFLVV